MGFRHRLGFRQIKSPKSVLIIFFYLQMAPDPGGIRTVGCNLEKLVPDKIFFEDIQTIVQRVHTSLPTK